ncbi:MAG: nuclear transport factor 2 family protein [Flavobacteriales bacterium]|nr:nuclear transport factor 2 family protein [Flavobacteriales bacterium]
MPSSACSVVSALVALGSGLMVVGCGHTEGWDGEAAVREVMLQQEQAWDRGDIPGFMVGYDEKVCFISPKGSTCGRDSVTARYLRTYPDQQAMGDLEFGIGEVLPAGNDHAWCTGTWKLHRSRDTVAGGFSLFWARTPQGWRILRDHTY